MEALAIQQLNGEDSLTLFSTPQARTTASVSSTPMAQTIGRGVLTWRPLTTLTVETGAETAYNWLRQPRAL